MTDASAKSGTHLTPDELELFALEGAARPRKAGTHLASCARCRREVRSLRSLHVELSGLASFAPAAGFADRVMARVVLPVPWHLRARQFTRERWAPLAAAFVAMVGATVAATLWMADRPEFSPIGVLALMVEQTRAFMLRAAMTIGGVLWESSLVQGVVGMFGAIGFEELILILAALSLVTIGAAGTMLRLMQPTTERIGSAA